jgi:hypothetical protein
VAAYVINNAPAAGICGADMRQEYLVMLGKMCWRPAELQRELIADRIGLIGKGLVRSARRDDELAKERMRLKETETRALTQKFLTNLEGWTKDQAKMSETLDMLYREFKDEDTLGIIVRLKDDEPLNRWMAIQVAQRRWEKVEHFLVELLDDPVPMVRQAAHQALVKLSRGADHGPFAASPTPTQIRTAQKQWRAYVEMQDRGP